MVELREKIRKSLRGRFSEQMREFASENAFELAVEGVYRRAVQLEKLSSKLGSVEKAQNYLRQTAERRRDRVFPQNDVPLNSLVYQSGSNGLCPLPSRMDCLTGLCTRYPETEPASDLCMEEVLSEPIAVDWSSVPADATSSVSLRRLKLKPL